MKIKFRHKFMFWVLYPWFKLFFRLKYGFRYKKFSGLKPPFLVISNHSSMIDAFMCSLSFRHKVIAYVASDFIFDNSFGSKLMQYLVNPISITKGQADLKAVRDILSIIKQKGIVGLYPSGSTTYSGQECYIEPSIVKMVRVVKCPVLLYRVDGMYGVDPRWRNKLRKGKALGEVVKTFLPEDIANKTDEELYKDIIFHLSPKQTELCLSGYTNKARAEYLERVLFICPNCETENNLYTKQHTIYCRHCGFSAVYKEDLTFMLAHPVKINIERVKDWMDFQIKHISSKNFDEIDSDQVLLEDDAEMLFKKPKQQKKELLEENISIKLYKNRFVFFEHEFKIDDITSVNMQNRNMLLLTVSGERYILKGKARTNHYKYLLYICKLNKKLSADLEKQQ